MPQHFRISGEAFREVARQSGHRQDAQSINFGNVTFTRGDSVPAPAVDTRFPFDPAEYVVDDLAKRLHEIDNVDVLRAMAETDERVTAAKHYQARIAELQAGPAEEEDTAA